MTCSFAAARGFRMLLELTLGNLCKIKLPHSAVSVCLSVSLFLPFLTFLFLSFFVYFPFLPPSPSLFLRMCLCLCISLFCLYVPTYANISTYLYTSPSANLPIYRRIYQSHSPPSSTPPSSLHHFQPRNRRPRRTTHTSRQSSNIEKHDKCIITAPKGNLSGSLIL